MRQTLELPEAVDFPRPAAILGHSLGAAVALGAAARQPDRIGRLVLVTPMLDFNATSAWSRLFRMPAAGELARSLFRSATAGRRARRNR